MKQNILIAIFLSVFMQSLQAVPSTVNYQGYLTDPTGSPITGTVSIVFSLYDADSAGSLSWSETQPTIIVSQGLFKVQLGSVTPFATGQFDIPMWLGVKVGADAEMVPLQALDSVGYALKAEDAETLAGLNPVDLDQSAHVTNTTNPHNVTAAQTGAATVIALSGHTANTANPHNVTAAQTGAASTTDFSTHSGNSAAHHTRYADSEAVTAMGTRIDTNPLNHNKYGDSQAVAAIKADAGTGLNADTVDNLHANEIIDAASDEVRTPISSLPFTISTSGSYYVTQNLDGTAGGINVNVDNVTIDLMGFTLNGNGIGDYGINSTGKSAIVIKNGTIHGFGFAGIYNNNAGGKGNVVSEVQVIGNGSLGTGSIYSGIYLQGSSSRVERCIVRDNGGYGIFVGNDSIITNSNVENSGGVSGIRGGYNSRLENNTAAHNQGTYGIYVLDNSSLNNNSVYNNQGTNGIYTGTSSILSNNTVRLNKGIGVYINSGIVRDNTVTGNDLGGIKSVLSSSISKNLVWSNGKYGIEINTNSIVKNNIITYNELSGVIAEKSNILLENNISFNNTSNTGGHGGAVVNGENTITHNLFKSNYRTSLLINGTRNTVEHNSVIGNSLTGINGITFILSSNYYAHNRVGGHSNQQYELSGLVQIDGGDNIQF